MNQHHLEQKRLLESGRLQLSRFKALAAIREQDMNLSERLLAIETPDIEAIIDVARLLKRYCTPAPADATDPVDVVRQRLERTMALWDMDEDTINRRAREAWQSGYRPRVGELEVGSGAM
jgi:capsid portal protein